MSDLGSLRVKALKLFAALDLYNKEIFFFFFFLKNVKRKNTIKYKKKKTIRYYPMKKLL